MPANKKKSTVKQKKPSTKIKKITPEIRTNFIALGVFVFVLLIIPIATCVSNNTSNYIAELDDIPLPASFKQLEDETLNYDTPEGRIIETYAIGRGDKDAIEIFYSEMLLNLGWKIENNHNNKIMARYVKDEEMLDITLEDNKNSNIKITFHLSPFIKD